MSKIRNSEKQYYSKSILIPEIFFPIKLNNIASKIPNTKPKQAKIIGIPTRAPKARTVPKLNPGVSEVVYHPILIKESINNPPNEYITPATNPKSENNND